MQNPNSLTDKEKAIISDGLSSFAPLTDERCNYNAIIELSFNTKDFVKQKVDRQILSSFKKSS